MTIITGPDIPIVAVNVVFLQYKCFAKICSMVTNSAINFPK